MQECNPCYLKTIAPVGKKIGATTDIQPHHDNTEEGLTSCTFHLMYM